MEISSGNTKFKLKVFLEKDIVSVSFHSFICNVWVNEEFPVQVEFQDSSFSYSGSGLSALRNTMGFRDSDLQEGLDEFSDALSALWELLKPQWKAYQL